MKYFPSNALISLRLDNVFIIFFQLIHLTFLKWLKINRFYEINKKTYKKGIKNIHKNNKSYMV